MSPTAVFAYARQRVASPSAVLIGTNMLVNVLRIGNTMLLTRLLAPRDFGLTGIIFSIFFVVSMVTDAGFQAFVIRHERGEDPEFLDAIWTIHALRGTVLFLITAALSAPIGMIIGKPEVSPLMAVAALAFAIDGLISPAMFVALRTGGVRRLSFIDLAISVIQMAAAIVAAYFLRNAWAIVISQIVGSSVKAICTFTILPDAKRRVRFERPIAAELWRFSRVIGASSILTMVLAQVDKLVLARSLSLPQFGVYTIAANLAQVPVAIVMIYTTRILYPAVANGWRLDPGAIRQTIYGTRGPVFYGYLFAAGGMIGSAPIVVRILYDPRYVGAALYLSILALPAAMTMITRATSETLVAIGHTKTTLMLNVVRIVWLGVFGTIGFLLAGPIALVLVLGLIEIPAYLYGTVVMRKLHLLSPVRELRALLLIVAGAATGWLATIIFDLLLRR